MHYCSIRRRILLVPWRRLEYICNERHTHPTPPTDVVGGRPPSYRPRSPTRGLAAPSDGRDVVVRNNGADLGRGVTSCAVWIEMAELLARAAASSHAVVFPWAAALLHDLLTSLDLGAHGISPKTRVALHVPNGPLAATVLLATMVRYCAVPLDPLAPAASIASRLTKSRARCLITVPELLAVAPKVSGLPLHRSWRFSSKPDWLMTWPTVSLAFQRMRQACSAAVANPRRRLCRKLQARPSSMALGGCRSSKCRPMCRRASSERAKSRRSSIG
mmetsp:Transcript_15374/g.34365  ORF Transcript_15374/g.34365 Transcript_15374/m.34365 type:complete len:274 (+) Transcript_15374:73-894(+)